MKDADPTQELPINLHAIQDRLLGAIVEYSTRNENKLSQGMSDAQDQATRFMESMVNTEPKTKTEITAVLDDAKSQGRLSDIAYKLIIEAL
jgi:hypothetical protein